MAKLKPQIEKDFTLHFFPSFSDEHQRVLTDSILTEVELWITEMILEEEERYAKLPESQKTKVQKIGNSATVAVLKSVLEDIK